MDRNDFPSGLQYFIPNVDERSGGSDLEFLSGENRIGGQDSSFEPVSSNNCDFSPHFEHNLETGERREHNLETRKRRKHNLETGKRSRELGDEETRENRGSILPAVEINEDESFDIQKTLQGFDDPKTLEELRKEETEHINDILAEITERKSFQEWDFMTRLDFFLDCQKGLWKNPDFDSEKKLSYFFFKDESSKQDALLYLRNLSANEQLNVLVKYGFLLRQLQDALPYSEWFLKRLEWDSKSFFFNSHLFQLRSLLPPDMIETHLREFWAAIKESEKILYMDGDGNMVVKIESDTHFFDDRTATVFPKPRVQEKKAKIPAPWAGLDLPLAFRPTPQTLDQWTKDPDEQKRLLEDYGSELDYNEYLIRKENEELRAEGGLISFSDSEI